MRKLWFLVVSALLMGVVGCGPQLTPEQKLQGTWTGQLTMSGMPDALSSQGEKLRTATLQLNEDKTFKLRAMVISLEGTWTLEGQTLTITPSGEKGKTSFEVGGVDLNAMNEDVKLETNTEPLTFKVSEKWDKLTMTSSMGKVSISEMEKAKE